MDAEQTLEKMLSELPSGLKAAATEPGFHREGKKFQVHGEAKAGKSYFIASQPSPNLAIACGENGIGMYLDRKKGDYVFQVYDGATLDQAIKFAVQHENEFASLSWDNANLGWKMWMEHWKQELGKEDIRGRDWNPTKSSWNVLLFLIMQTKMNVGMGFWPRGAKYTQGESAPGVEGKLEMVQQDVAHTEKNVPFIVDHQFKAEVRLDKLFRPTAIHTLTLFGGRVPKGTPPELFVTGKVWSFDARKPDPKGPWHAIFDPLEPYWKGAEKSHLDLETRDLMEVQKSQDAIKQAWQDQELGRILRVIDEQKTLADFQRVWTEDLGIAINELGAEHKERAMLAKEAAKTRLSGK